LSRELAPGSSPDLSGLERYAEYFNAVEVNSTFYRLPRASTIERWQACTPAGFRFAVKVPRSITHEAGLVGADAEIRAFCQLCERFDNKLGALLVQLPPSLDFDAGAVARFLKIMARATPVGVVLEPRHPSWFTVEGDQLLAEHGVARAAADPACCPAAANPVQRQGLSYFRWHGWPRKYFSAYLPETLAALAREIIRARNVGGARAEVYCFLDNTGFGAAAVNALSLKSELARAR
jgi:uncharacterized protein YecE (DUF72 family)